MNLDSSVKSTEVHRCLVQETCSLAQDKRSLLCRTVRGHTQLVVLHRDLHYEEAIKRSSEGVVAHGWSGTCVLDTEASV